MTASTISVQILHVPDCALLAPTRALVQKALAATDIASATVECIMGDYPSPTVLINGTDVTGRSPARGAACRLDPPTEDQLRAALSRAVQPGEQEP